MEVSGNRRNRQYLQAVKTIFQNKCLCNTNMSNDTGNMFLRNIVLTDVPIVVNGGTNWYLARPSYQRNQSTKSTMTVNKFRVLPKNLTTHSPVVSLQLAMGALAASS